MLLANSPDVQGGSLVVRVEGMPDFNVGTHPTLQATRLDGWYGSAAPRALLVANGGGAGAVAVGGWEHAEAYYAFGGFLIFNDRTTFEEMRGLLLRSLPVDREVSLQVLGGAVDKQIFVRRYDAPTIEAITGSRASFVIPLVAPDPYKYGLAPLFAECGAFAPTDWYRTYIDDGDGDWYRTYDDDGADHYRNYEEDTEATSALPATAVLESGGDVASRRLTITVTGPLSAGDWWVEDAHGTRLWAEVGLADGQSVVFDSTTRTATLAGANIDHLVQGDYLQLEPGVNTYRLQVGTPTGGYATFEGLEGYL